MPLLILGSEIGGRIDSTAIQFVFQFFAKKSFLFLKNFNGFNVLHKHFSNSNFCDLGIAINSYSNLYILNSQPKITKDIS